MAAAEQLDQDTEQQLGALVAVLYASALQRQKSKATGVETFELYWDGGAVPRWRHRPEEWHGQRPCKRETE